MNLDKTDINVLRRMIEEKIVNVPNGKKIHIDKNILEKLLFVSLKDKDGKKAKFICWSGNFFDKIDLSEVNFDNVVWDLNFCKKYENIFDKNPYEKIESINLNNTNVNIDFSKSYEGMYINNRDRSISNVEIENVKGIIGFDIFNIIVKCNLKNSGATISNRENKVLGNKIIDSNLEGINLNNFLVDVKDLFDSNSKHCITRTNIKKTNIRINYSTNRPINYKDKLNKLNRLKNKDFKSEEETQKLYDLENELKSFIKLDYYGLKLGKLIKEGELIGCYINGKYIKDKELANQERKDRIEKLKKDKQELISSLENSIDIQILKLRNSNNGQVIIRM